MSRINLQNKIKYLQCINCFSLQRRLASRNVYDYYLIYYYYYYLLFY